MNALFFQYNWFAFQEWLEEDLEALGDTPLEEDPGIIDDMPPPPLPNNIPPRRSDPSTVETLPFEFAAEVFDDSQPVDGTELGSSQVVVDESQPLVDECEEAVTPTVPDTPSPVAPSPLASGILPSGSRTSGHGLSLHGMSKEQVDARIAHLQCPVCKKPCLLRLLPDFLGFISSPFEKLVLAVDRGVNWQSAGL